MNNLITKTLISLLAAFSVVVSANDELLSDEEVVVSLSLESLLISSNRGNLISLLQSGVSNDAVLIQNGSDNSVMLEQVGKNNFALINQRGDGNQVDYSQSGDSNFGLVNQVGNDNVVQVDSHGYTGFIIHQISDNTVLRITQY